MTLLELLGTSVCFFSLAVVAVGLLRPVVRWCFGAGPVYGLWLLPVFASLMAFVPGPAGPRVLVADPVAANAVQTAAATEVGSELRLDIGLAVLLLWLLGAVVAGVVQYRRHRRFCSELEPTIRLGTIGGAELLLSARIAAPVASGVLRPCIVLPDAFEQLYAADAQQVVLAHELQHLRRRDPVANVIANVIVGMFWFHPLAYWAYSRFRLDQELSCDEAVVASAPEQKRVYGEALLVAAASTSGAIGWSSSKRQVARRIAALQRPTKSAVVRQVGCATSALLVLCAGAMYHSLLPQGSVRLLSATEHAASLEGMSKAELGQNLMQAVAVGDTGLAQRLLALGAPLEFAMPAVGTPLILAAARGDETMVRFLVSNSADVNAAVLTAGSPLIVAAKHDHQDVARFLIAQGSDVNAHVFLDETPLINAARFGHVDMAKQLIRAGAEVGKSVTTFSITHLPLGTKSPLSEARRVGHVEVVGLLESAHD